MFELKVEGHFASAHRLLNYQGKCENPHGHNWKVEIYSRGEELNESNILIDFKVLKKELNDFLEEIDHIDLNEYEPFKGESPSSEFIARYIYKELKKKIPQLYKVAVWETERARATYWE